MIWSGYDGFENVGKYVVTYKMSCQIDIIHHPLKYIFGYATGFIFLVGIMIYLYMLIMDHLEAPNQHSTEETVWIYLFLCIMIIGFLLSYYSITCSIKDLKNSGSYKKLAEKAGFAFGGSKMNIPSRPSVGQNKTLHISKFTV
jgi:Na+/melibiose symporter-like transporter